MQSTGNRQNRGFASMDAERQREIARKGGRAAHEKGTAHQFTSDEARAAGRKGGERVSQNRSHMAEIGRMGGRRSAGRRQAVKVNPETGIDTQAMSEASTPRPADESVPTTPDSENDRT